MLSGHDALREGGPVCGLKALPVLHKGKVTVQFGLAELGLLSAEYPCKRQYLSVHQVLQCTSVTLSLHCAGQNGPVPEIFRSSSIDPNRRFNMARRPFIFQVTMRRRCCSRLVSAPAIRPHMEVQPSSRAPATTSVGRHDNTRVLLVLPRAAAPPEARRRGPATTL